MKKLLLLASALTGFAFVAQAEEATTIKTTTVQYQVPTCTNCRTTSEVRTVYPEQKPVCTTCGVSPQPILAQEPAPASSCTEDNHKLGIRNPLFVLKKDQWMARQTAGVFKEPKHYSKEAHDDIAENRGGSFHSRLAYGITDRWSAYIFGGTEYVTPKKSSFPKEQWVLPPPAGGYHTHVYRASAGTEYHLLDLCHFDAIVGLSGTWRRVDTQYRNGSKAVKNNGYTITPTVKLGAPIGWFTPFIEASYIWDNLNKKQGEKKTWERTHGYYINPGVYFQPSKWVGFSFDFQKWEKSDNKPQWNVRADFYPYKNVSLSLQLNARRPFKDPMDMYGAAADFGIVF